MALFITCIYIVIRLSQKCKSHHFLSLVHYICNKLDVSPYSIKGSDGKIPLPFRGLASDKVLRKMVGQLTGFSHESIIFQIFAGYLLIDVL